MLKAHKTIQVIHLTHNLIAHALEERYWCYTMPTDPLLDISAIWEDTADSPPPGVIAYV